MRAVFIVIIVLMTTFNSHAAEEDTHRLVASQLLRLTGVEQMMAGMASTMSDAITNSNPILQPYRSVIKDWASKTMTWENFEDRFVGAYVEAFTEAELREMISFYETPTGKKAVQLQPVLMQKGVQFGSEVAAEHQAELEAMLEKRKAGIEALNSKTDD